MIPIEKMRRAAHKYCQVLGLDPAEIIDGRPRWESVAVMLREHLAIRVALRQQI
jgi:hypothetical protein